MTSWIYATGVQTAKTLAGGELGVIGRDAVIASATGIPVTITNQGGETSDLLIAGQALSPNSPAISGVTATMNIAVAQTGIVSGLFGISFWAGALVRVSNAGEVLASHTAVALTLSTASTLTDIFNTGRMFGGHTAVFLNTINTTNAAIINNSGVIEGGQNGIVKNQTLAPGTAGAIKIINTGTITADSFALDLRAGNDRVVNSGLIDGKVDLGMGNDTFNTRFGEVRSSVLGGQGLDSFRPGRFEDSFDGGTDTDTLDLRGAGSVAVDLRNILENTGVAEGDVYLNVENIIGSGAADQLHGSVLANSLRGMAGADALDGDAGNDVITGGAGKDTLTGGAGSDQFMFFSRNELGDTITDFGDSAGNQDQLRISAAALGGGLSAGTVAAGAFISRAADHAAQDANDRFILNKADKTLWFDADGSGAGAAILVVDLQNSTSFGAGDMVLV